MVKNVGTYDRLVRVFIGLLAFALGSYLDTGWGWLGLIPMATAMLAWDPIYSVFGIDTHFRPPKRRKTIHESKVRKI